MSKQPEQILEDNLGGLTRKNRAMEKGAVAADVGVKNLKNGHRICEFQ